jgi:hypothetical protein
MYNSVGFGVPTAVVMKSTVFWNITLCSPLKVNPRFRGTYRLHLQGIKISSARKEHEWRWQAELCLPLPFTLVSCMTFNGQHSVISQKTVFFKYNSLNISDVILTVVETVHYDILESLV